MIDKINTSRTSRRYASEKQMNFYYDIIRGNKFQITVRLVIIKSI